MLTAQEREERRAWLGSSDIAALFGENPWQSALGVHASKVFDLDEPEDTGEAVDLGNDYELPNLRWAAHKLGVELHSLGARTVGEIPLFVSTHDALVVGRREGMEAKVRMEYRDGEFGEPGTDQVPARVIWQCQHQMYTGNLERVWVPVMLPFRGRLARRLYKVERSERLIAALLEVGQAFWHNHVLPKIPPPAVFGEVEIFKRIEREVGRIARVPAELVEAWKAADRATKAAEKEEAVAFTNLLAAVGDGEGWEWDDSGRYYTYSEYPRHTVDREAVERILAQLHANIGRLPLEDQAAVLRGLAEPDAGGLSAVEYLKNSPFRRAYLRKPETKRKRRK